MFNNEKQLGVVSQSTPIPDQRQINETRPLALDEPLLKITFQTKMTFFHLLYSFQLASLYRHKAKTSLLNLSRIFKERKLNPDQSDPQR